MAQPPVQLEESYYDVVSLEASPDYVPDPRARPVGPPEREALVKLDLATVDADPGVWRVSLDLRHREAEDETPRYRFRLRVVGFFRWGGGETPNAEVAQLVAVNGASILYSSAREFLLLLTSRMPWGQLSLPTLSFADVELSEH